MGKEYEKPADGRVRLQKYLANAGVSSRRSAEELIESGAVAVNGAVAHIGDKVDPFEDRITVRGREIRIDKQRTYVMLNKPRGYVTTMLDERGRKCVRDLVADVGERVLPVGRLDKDSEGMLLLTNDGALIQSMTHPSYELRKYYYVTIAGDISREKLDTLNDPMTIEGYELAPVQVTVKERKPDRTVLTFVLTEGRNRQIRKMCDVVGVDILRLKRQGIGDLQFKGLPVGKWRFLEEKEIRYLKALSLTKPEKHE